MATAMVTAMVTVKFSSAVLLPVASYHFCCTSAFLLLSSLQLLLFFLLILLLLLFRSSFCSFSISFPASDAVAKYKPNSCSSVFVFSSQNGGQTQRGVCV